MNQIFCYLFFELDIQWMRRQTKKVNDQILKMLPYKMCNSNTLLYQFHPVIYVITAV